MTRKHAPISGAASAAMPIAILLVAYAAPVAAQTPPGPQPPSPKLEEVVVTGSLVRREDIITPSPVTVISAEDIENSGMTTITDVVRSISADNSGTIPNRVRPRICGGLIGGCASWSDG